MLIIISNLGATIIISFVVIAVAGAIYWPKKDSGNDQD